MNRFLLSTALLVCCGMLFAADATKAPRAFFAMDNGLNDVASVQEKAALLKELGYAGIGWRPGRTAEMLKALDANGLKMFSFYISVGSDPDSKLSANLSDELTLLKGRETIVWVLVTKPKGKTGDDASAARQIREVADLATANSLRVAIYPHAGCYVETSKDALRVLKAVDRPNVGLSFNLCHFLKLDSEERLEEALREVAPHLMLVQTNGADSGDTKKMSWDRLIQPLGDGTYDNAKLLAALDKIGFTGPIGLQCYQLKAPAREHLARSMAAWRKLNEGGSRTEQTPKPPSASPAPAPLATPAGADELKELIAKAATYDHGQSRAALAELLEKAQAAKPDEWPAIETALAGLLSAPKATNLSKLAVCGLLAHRGGKDSVAALAALLPDEKLSYVAAYALGLNMQPEAERALLESLPKLAAPQREHVVTALGTRRCAGAVEPLSALLNSAADQPPLFAAVCMALARIGDRRAAEALQENLNRVAEVNRTSTSEAEANALSPTRESPSTGSGPRATSSGADVLVPPEPVGEGGSEANAGRGGGSPPSQQSAVADAALQCAERLAADGAKDDARKLYEALLALKALPLARAGAVKGLAILSSESAPDVLTTALTDNDRHVRYAALAALKSVPGEALTTRAAGLLAQLPPDQAVQLIEVLTIRGDRSARPAVVLATSHKEEAVSVAALNALALFGKTEDVPLLLEKLNVEGPVAQAAGFALTRLPDKGVAARVREALAVTAAKRQTQLVRLLADRADPNDAAVLCELVSGGNAALAVEAARGLKLAGGEAEFRRVVELLAAEIDAAQVRSALETAAARIVKRLWQGDSAKVVALLKDAPDRQRASLLSMLSLIGDDRALPAVLEASKAADGPVKDAAVRALADWPTATPLKELLELAKATPSEKQHVLAMRGYIRMLDLLKEKPPANLKALYEAGQKAAKRDEERRALDPAKAAAKPAARAPVGYE